MSALHHHKPFSPFRTLISRSAFFRIDSHSSPHILSHHQSNTQIMPHHKSPYPFSRIYIHDTTKAKHSRRFERAFRTAFRIGQHVIPGTFPRHQTSISPFTSQHFPSERVFILQKGFGSIRRYSFYRNSHDGIVLAEHSKSQWH